MIPGVESFLEQYHMIEQSDVVVAGVSGGADSVCLLLHLLELKENFPLRWQQSMCSMASGAKKAFRMQRL